MLSRLLCVLLPLALALSACGPTRLALISDASVAPIAAVDFAATAPLAGPLLPASRRPHVVALSGGGPDGAFGAGYMVGRIERGAAAPDIITGVSIGALVGTLAFVGDKAALTALFAGGGLAGAASDADPLRGLFGGSLMSGDVYADAIDAALDDAVIARVAAEHRRGRRLFVATTELDDMRTIVWDMGAIASQPGAGAKEFFRRVVLASGSIPGIFPPVPLAGDTGRRLFVDGGASRQFYLPELPARRAARDALVVINNALGGDGALERYTAFDTLQLGFSSLIRAQERDQIALARLRAQRSGTRFTAISLPPGVPAGKLQDFSPDAMARKFEIGRKLAHEGA